MNSRRGQDLQKPFLGYMGRMINIFDLSTGITGTKLLTDKAHRDGSPISRNQSDVVKKTRDPILVPIEDKQITSELRRKSSSNKNSGGIPMKMLIQQEMWKEAELKQKPANVVARLMGLDTLPVQQSVLTVKKSSQEGYTHSLGGALRGHWQQEDEYFHNPVVSEVSHEKHEYKDVHEVWQQPSKINHVKDQPPQRGRYDENSYEKKMTLVRQKFNEAKHAATDEKLLQSEEFQDALEVLSSNRDLFLKFLEEPNSLLSKHLHELQTISPPQTKCITVLKPSKTSEVKCDKIAEKQFYSAVEENKCDENEHYWNPSLSHAKAHNLSQPTRIVVLKPSPGKLHDIKNTVASAASSAEQLGGQDSYGDLGIDGVAGSREIAKEITRQMRESLTSKRRGVRTFLSSVLSNGYVGDESSFSRSEIEYMDEEGGNLSDYETATPTSRHSWDHINRIGSPCSISSVSRKSYSPESSVIREARKRLSERWALVASNVNGQEQRQTQRSSSTLGEMLAIPELKKEEENSRGLTVSSSRSCDVEQNLKVLSPCVSTDGLKEGCRGEFTLRNLSRSRSVPSSSSYEVTELNLEVSDALISKPIVHNDIAKSKSGKSSFKGKVSSLFFSTNKKQGQEKSIPSPSVGCDDKLQADCAEFDCKRNSLLQSVDDKRPKQSALFSLYKNSGQASSLTTVYDVTNRGTFCAKGAHSLKKPMTCRNSSENLDHPSPVSVLQVPFVDDVHSMSQASESLTAGHPQALSRSPPIESIARSLSCDGSNLGKIFRNPLKPSGLAPKVEEEQERLVLVQKLLSSAGFCDENSDMIFTRWHSLDSPLNPMLMDEYLDRKEEAAKCKERRSKQRLLFDCVNAALLNMGQTAVLASYPRAGACRGSWKDDGPAGGALVTRKVCDLVRNWYSGEEKFVPDEPSSVTLTIDRVVKREVAGRGWAELMWLEMYEFSKDIGSLVLEELVEEALLDFN